MEVNGQYLDNLFKKLDIILTEKQLSQFIEYHKLLIEWNEKINLTAITEFEDVCLKHFLDSASIVKLFSSFKEAVISSIITGLNPLRTIAVCITQMSPASPTISTISYLFSLFTISTLIPVFIFSKSASFI